MWTGFLGFKWLLLMRIQSKDTKEEDWRKKNERKRKVEQEKWYERKREAEKEEKEEKEEKKEDENKVMICYLKRKWKMRRKWCDPDYHNNKRPKTLLFFYKFFGSQKVTHDFSFFFRFVAQNLLKFSYHQFSPSEKNSEMTVQYWKLYSFEKKTHGLSNKWDFSPRITNLKQAFHFLQLIQKDDISCYRRKNLQTNTINHDCRDLKTV